MINFLKKYVCIDLILFFTINEGKKYSINQVSRLLRIALGSSKTMCSALEQEDFLTKEIIGKSHLYSLNPNNLNAILLKKIAFPYILNSQKVTEFFKKQKENIISGYLFGSCANGTYDAKSDIDLFILSTNKLDKTNQYDIQKYIESFFYGREIQLSIYSLSEFKKLKNNPFLKEIKKGIKIYGEDI